MPQEIQNTIPRKLQLLSGHLKQAIEKVHREPKSSDSLHDLKNALAEQFDAYIIFLRELIEGSHELGVGDHKEIEVVLADVFAIAKAFRRRPCPPMLDLVVHLSAICTWILFERSDYHSAFRKIAHENTEQQQLFGHCMSLLIDQGDRPSESSPWQKEEALEVKAHAIDFMVTLLDRMGYRADADIAWDQIASSRPLTSAQILQLATLQRKFSPPQARDFLVERASLKGIMDHEHAADPTLRFWSSNDPLVAYLFSGWRWLEEINLQDAPTDEEQMLLREQADLYEVVPSDLLHIEDSTTLGVNSNGSKAKVAKHKSLSPIPIAMIGGPDIGKTSFLTSLMYLGHEKTAMGQYRFSAGRTLQQHYEAFAPHWLKKQPSRTADFCDYSIHLDSDDTRNGMDLCFTDYRGEETSPGEFNNDLQAVIKKARGFLLFVDANNMSTRQDRWYTEIMRSFAQVNPLVRNIPIAIVVTKVDLSLETEMQELNRYRVVGDGLQKPLIYLPIPSGRMLHGIERDPGNPQKRLISSVLQESWINSSIGVRNLVRGVLKNFSKLIQEGLSLTYNIEIFLTSSVLNDTWDNPNPRGIPEVVAWLGDCYRSAYSHEAVKRVTGEIERLTAIHNKSTGYFEQFMRLFDEWERACAKRRSAKAARVKKRWSIIAFTKSMARHDALVELLESDMALTLSKIEGLLEIEHEDQGKAPFAMQAAVVKTGMQELGSCIANLSAMIKKDK